MTLPGEVQAAPPGQSGFDADSIVSAETAKLFYDQDYRFCVRYLSRGASQGSGDLSYDEADGILQAGLALMAVQHVSEPGWTPSQSLGTTYGTNAAANAQSVGLPPGMNIWCDLEGVDTSVSAGEVVAYCNAWYGAVAAAGYVPGIYIGYDTLLTGEQLYYQLQFQHYWKGAGKVPEVAVRGYQLVQTSINLTVNGIGIDADTTQTDQKQGQALWLTRATSQAT